MKPQLRFAWRFIDQQPEVLDQLMRELEELGDADGEIAGPHISQLYVRKRYAFTPLP